MRAVETPTSTTLEIAGGEELAVALDMMDPLALGLYDRDIASAVDAPEGVMRVQINVADREREVGASYLAGWIYVCATGFVYQLTIMPGNPIGGRWFKAANVKS